jgi:hypothetical protein
MNDSTGTNFLRCSQPIIGLKTPMP